MTDSRAAMGRWTERPPEADEAFFTDAQVAAAFPGVAPEQLRGLWPAALPHDFDHQFLRRLGLKCGRDEGPDEVLYALLDEGRAAAGWRVWRVVDLTHAVTAAVEAGLASRELNPVDVDGVVSDWLLRRGS